MCVVRTLTHISIVNGLGRNRRGGLGERASHNWHRDKKTIDRAHSIG